MAIRMVEAGDFLKRFKKKLEVWFCNHRSIPLMIFYHYRSQVAGMKNLMVSHQQLCQFISEWSMIAKHD
jgi:hypothetical protein